MATDENVALLQEFLSYQLNKDDTKRLLAISGHNIEAAAQKYYETDPSALQRLLKNSVSSWDETAFASGRYGTEGSSDTLPTFNMDYPSGFEHYPHSTGHSRAPTRPPSRTSQRSALSTHAGDAPLQSIEHMQESGIIGGSNAAFGPANRNEYEPSQWAMVQISKEVISDPEPSLRKREEGEPAILKPSSNFNYLSALVPILHSIPQFRNALLCAKVARSDYWMGDDWWKGTPTPPARIVDTTLGVHESNGLDIIYEAQRLMAFLENTDRIYGSISSLVEQDAWRELQVSLSDPDDDLLKFLLVWSEAYERQNPDAALNGSLRSTVIAGDLPQDNFVLDGAVTRDPSRTDLDLYDVLDDSLFSAAGATAHIVDMSNVIILRLTSSKTNASDLGCRIPATLYADRYLNQNRHIIEGMYEDMTQYEQSLRDIDAQVQKLKYHTPRKAGAGQVESLKLLQTSMKAFNPDDGIAKDAETFAQLQTLYNSIESKLAELDEQTQKLRTTVNGISRRFKPIIDDGSNATSTSTDQVMEGAADPVEEQYPEGQAPHDAMKHPYRLHGVATRRDVLYLLHPDINSNVPGAKQWWRMQYDTESSNPIISRDRVGIQEVVERASTEAASVLLVYANDEAASAEPLPLTEPLKDFVKKDNLNFLQEQQTGWESYGAGYGESTIGNWDNELPTYNDEDAWNDMTASSQNWKHDHETMSSTTLTPNTELGDDEPQRGVREMVEVNGGMDAFTGLSSAPAADTGASQAMDLDSSQVIGRSSPSMMAVDDAPEPKIQHLEHVERKGG